MEKNTIHFKQLAQCPEHLETIGNWIYKEWWETPDNTPDIVYKPLREHLVEDAFPYAIVAFSGDQPAGCCLVIEKDCDIRPQYSPWLAAVLVQEEYRGLGIGSKMIREAFSVAEKIKLNGIYIDCAREKVDFYKRNGWDVLEEVPVTEEPDTVIMYRKVK